MIAKPDARARPNRSKEAVPFGRLLAIARKKLNLTQGAVARNLLMTNAQISRIEHGADLRVSTLLDVARYLQFEPMLIPKDRVASVHALLSDEAEYAETPTRGRFT